MEALIQERGKIKAKLTRFITFLSKLDVTSLEGVSLQQEIQIKDRLDTISPILKEYEGLYGEIYNLTADKNEADEDCWQFEDSYFESTSLAKSLINKSRMPRSQSDQSINSDASSNHVSSIAGESKTRYLNLPKINLAKFSGDMNSWVQFKNTRKAYSEKHHTMLHDALARPAVSMTNRVDAENEEPEATEETNQTISAFCANLENVLLPTALAKARDITGLVNPNASIQVSCNHITTNDISHQLTKSSETKKYPKERALSSEANAYEEHYVKNTKRDDEGRFIVSIPLKQSVESLGDSLKIAKKRFFALEKRLAANPDLTGRYHEFMKEYKYLGHVTKVVKDKLQDFYYLPHQGVLKEDSTTTKLRVVFNGFSATLSGISLNEMQMVGPTIQPDLFTILMRFRRHRFAVAADAEKMYRQVQIDPSQRSLQRILWRFSNNNEIDTYELNKVTYGKAYAAFLAIRSLNQLEKDCKTEIAEVIEKDFYVDDFLSGANTIHKAQTLCKLSSEVLASGGFMLRKWISNNPDALSNILKSELHPGILNKGDQENTETLGLQWSHLSDQFMFTIQNYQNVQITKRVMLDEIAQIFDPIELLAPCIITAKIMLQQLWMEKLEWDDEVPRDIKKKWQSYRTDLVSLNDIRIPRRILCNKLREIQIHEFCDTSVQTYGACIYVRSIDANDNVHINLMCAKTKVAPLKPTTYPPFSIIGVDYAGPITIKDRKGRGAKHSKAYICLYVYFCTKAINIELVSDLTSAPFLMSFRRFVACRNKPSDNGTNFLGTNSQLKELGAFIRKNKKVIIDACASEGNAWSFIPAHSPHFGGLYEASVKACKYHLKRVLGLQAFTFEELCTLLVQVEALLNSRPIAPLSSDPPDLQPLTLAHFLVGKPLVSLPDSDLTLLRENRLATFQRLQLFQKRIWKRWNKEYVTELQQRLREDTKVRSSAWVSCPG